jgi:hypothetical protein
VVSGSGERRQLIAPGIPPLRKSVTEQNQASRPLLGEVDTNAVGRHGVLLKIMPSKIIH